MNPSHGLEALNWRDRETLRSKMRRAVSVPALVGASVFLVALITAAVCVLLQPHGSAASTTVEPRGDAAISEVSGLAPHPLSNADGALGAEADPREGVLVHVAGEVASPGVIELPAGSRVHEAIAAAGGPTAEAVLAGVNLARVLVDGEQILVPGPGAAPPAAGSAPDDGRVDLNAADATRLETLPGVGPTIARRIVEWRTANGPFTSVEQLRRIEGIGDQKFSKLRDLVFV